MKPLKRKDILKITSDELNMPIETIDTVVSFFYSELSKKLKSADHVRVSVKSLGTFLVIKKRILNSIKKEEKLISLLSNNTSMQSYKNMMERKENVEKLHKLIDTLNNDSVLKKEKEKEKEEYIKNKKHV